MSVGVSYLTVGVFSFSSVSSEKADVPFIWNTDVSVQGLRVVLVQKQAYGKVHLFACVLRSVNSHKQKHKPQPVSEAMSYDPMQPYSGPMTRSPT